MSSVLAILMEPAPYSTGLVRELRSAWSDKLDVVYVGRNLSQVWADQPDETQAGFLPEGNIAALRYVLKHLSRSAYDLLHIAGWGHPILMGAMLTAAMRGIPIIAETDTPPPRYEALWRRLSKAILYPALFALPTKFLPAGSRQAAYLRRYNVKARDIVHAKMTVDTEEIGAFAARFTAQNRSEFRRRHGIAGRTKTVFLYLGRLEPFKGIQDLFDAFIRLRTQRNDVALIVAGSGSLEQFVGDAAASLRSVHYLGHLVGERVWEAYSAVDVLVVPSRREPWGLVVNEAMAAGLPVIVSENVGCADDLVQHDVTGLVVKARMSGSLYSAMLDLADNPEKRTRFGAEARALISGWTLAEEARIIASAWRDALA
jgi:glycosyltransferase involved in cell wall biosynthesis